MKPGRVRPPIPLVRTEPIDTAITGALLPGMTDAIFIANGFFSGDGTGSYIAFTNGPHGWGTIAPGPGEGTLIPTGDASTDNTTPGNSYTEFFSSGDLDRIDTGVLSFDRPVRNGRLSAATPGAAGNSVRSRLPSSLPGPRFPCRRRH